MKIKYEKGDLVTVTQNLTLHRFPVGKVVKIFRSLPPAWYDCCDDNGDCCLISKSEIQLYTINKTNMKAMKNAVLTVAKQLVQANNTVTTLEIKLQLRRDYPYFYWDQSTVSAYMDGFAGDGIFSYVDSTTIPIHRIYSIVKPLNKVVSYSPMPIGYKLTKTTNKAATVTIRAAGLAKPTKKLLNTIKRANLVDFVINNKSKVQGVYTVTGMLVDIPTIKSQKKSLIGYVNMKKHTLKGLCVKGNDIMIIN